MCMDKSIDVVERLYSKFNRPLTCLSFGVEGEVDTKTLGETLQEKGVLVYVDPNLKHIKSFQKECAGLEDVITWVDSDHVHFISNWKHEKFDFTYLDTENDSVISFEKFLDVVPKMNIGGVLIVNDCGLTLNGTRPYYQSNTVKGHKIWEYLNRYNIEYSMWVGRHPDEIDSESQKERTKEEIRQSMTRQMIIPITELLVDTIEKMKQMHQIHNSMLGLFDELKKEVESNVDDDGRPRVAIIERTTFSSVISETLTMLLESELYFHSGSLTKTESSKTPAIVFEMSTGDMYYVRLNLMIDMIQFDLGCKCRVYIYDRNDNFLGTFKVSWMKDIYSILNEKGCCV